MMKDLFGNEILEQVKQKTRSPQKKKITTIQQVSVNPDTKGLLGCKDFGKYIREERDNKTII